MDRSKARSLQPLELRARPIAPQAISWSCDAELAIATTDSIHIFLPEYPRPGNGSADDAADEDAFQPQFTLTLTTSGILRPDPAINGPLCAFAGVSLPAAGPNESFVFRGVGSAEVTKSGSSLGQSLRVEWSPTGLGQNLRPVLSIMTTSGSVVTMGEHIDSRHSMASTLRSRTFRHWKVLWGLGAQLPIPDGKNARGFRNMNERIVSFSWAKEVDSGRALLAYMNDEREVVIMSVQFLNRASEADEAGAAGEESGWEIFEIARFDGKGPHDIAHLEDADFVPSGGAFCLKWSPWFITKEFRTATIAYVSKNHVGFRRLTIRGAWLRGQKPNVRVEKANSVSICTFLSADAFVEWENHVWQEGDSQLAHLIIHHPDPSNKPPEPLYSLIRLSATPTNHDWYQTNLPSQKKLPQWAERVHRAVGRQVSRVEALGGIDSESDTDSEFEEPEVDMTMMPKEEHLSKVYPHRFRLWGMAASPGDGCIATLLSKHVTQHTDRRPRSRVLFSWPTHDDHPMTSTTSSITATPFGSNSASSSSLTTEGTVWEAMYGNILEIPTSLSKPTDRTVYQETSLRRQFKSVIPEQTCVFCNTSLVTVGNESICEKGHSFATCAATGLAILAPGISRICSVCDLRCLNISELSRIATSHIGPGSVVESLGEACGGCGGKFLI
ncbi:hypothetical protein E4U21_007084 [Claviceps maximensis]|nr:hypothetical protein E4U21_007084 [Claviceps maximensis]